METNRFLGKTLKSISTSYFDENCEWYSVYWTDGSSNTVHKCFDIEEEIYEALGCDVFDSILKETYAEYTMPFIKKIESAIAQGLINKNEEWY